MKATRPQPVSFVPVTVTLETQEEVDKLCGILRCAAIVNELGIGSLWLELDPFTTVESNRYTAKVIGMIRTSI